MICHFVSETVCICHFVSETVCICHFVSACSCCSQWNRSQLLAAVRRLLSRVQRITGIKLQLYHSLQQTHSLGLPNFRFQSMSESGISIFSKAQRLLTLNDDSNWNQRSPSLVHICIEIVQLSAWTLNGWNPVMMLMAWIIKYYFYLLKSLFDLYNYYNCFDVHWK